ncbi:hypothetical protein [Bradyrhizobium sp. RDI18]|uniref:hypothetical protein n=1 Tax=Bradyrhizobium sp. RDI18 TaxID=3367400 RepID=UPI00371EE946
MLRLIGKPFTIRTDKVRSECGRSWLTRCDAVAPMEMMVPAPVARMLSDEIAPAVAFLTSDAAHWVSGVNRPVDGRLASTYVKDVLTRALSRKIRALVPSAVFVRHGLQ